MVKRDRRNTSDKIAIVWAGIALFVAVSQQLAMHDFLKYDICSWVIVNVSGIRKLAEATQFHASAAALMAYYFLTFMPVLIFGLWVRATPFARSPSSNTKTAALMILVMAGAAFAILVGVPGLPSDNLAHGGLGGLYARTFVGMYFIVSSMFLTIFYFSLGLVSISGLAGSLNKPAGRLTEE